MSEQKPHSQLEQQLEHASFAELHEALDPKEQRFVDEYLECVNATLAARRVWGHKSSKQTGYKLFQRPDVAAAIAAGLREQRERTHNDPDRIIRELMLVAYADPSDLVDRSGRPLPLHKLPAEIRRAVASIDIEREKITTEEITEEIVDGAAGQVATGKKRATTRTQIVKVRLTPKTQALELLGKRLKMWGNLEIDASDRLSVLIAQAFGRPAPAPDTSTEAGE